MKAEKCYIAVDFDGTVVTHDYPYVGKELDTCVDVLKDLTDAGHLLIINTMRSGSTLQDAVEWYAKNGIPVFGVNNNPTQLTWTQSPKVYAHLYIDDAALGAPVISNPNFHTRPFINWVLVREFLVKNNYLNKQPMKTLTEKIIEALEFIKTESQGELIRESFNLGINKAIDIIKEIEKEDDLNAISRQMMKYLSQFHHPQMPGTCLNPPC